MPAGLGGQDAQGQWQFGELDNAGGLASDLLNLGQSRVSAGFAADRARLETLEAPQGLVWLETLQGTGTEIIINNLDSTYTGFLVELASRGTVADITGVLRTAANVDVVTGYDRSEILGRSGVASASTGASAASWPINNLPNSRHMASLHLEGLSQPVNTLAILNAGTHSSPAQSSNSSGVYTRFLSHQGTAAYRGLKLTLSASQTYVCRIFGKR